jgi:trehalose 6-phosphate synthase/phosphatase
VNRLITVSNRLPINVDKVNGKLKSKPSIGGLATGLSSFYKSHNSVWVGWSGVTTDELTSKSERDELLEILKKDGCFPVFLSDKEIEYYYEGFANKTLWPLFHYFQLYAETNTDYWEQYREVNQRFCDVLLELATPEDDIWVHDYHLMLLPAMLREKMPDARIGFFLHIPFPSFEIFRILPWREEILSGLLGSDLIGFHTYEYAQHFLNSARRLLNYDFKRGQLIIGNRVVKVDAFPMGIDYERFTTIAESPEVEKEIESFHEKVGKRNCILCVDRLDYTKGILQRLRAFDHFLEKNPEYLEKVTLIMVAVPSRTGVDTYADLKAQIDEIVGRINGEYGTVGWVPIWYMFRPVPFERLVGLYKFADIGLVTPLRDGMNLVSKEFVACKTDGKGVLILSELAGASKELGEALIVNPFNREEIESAIKEAMNMPVNEQVKRNRIMQKRLKRYNVIKWAEDFICQLQNIKETQMELEEQKINKKIKPVLFKDYRDSENRLLLLDYDGTLVQFVKEPKDAEPDEGLMEIIKELTDIKENSVIIISGRDRETLHRWFNNIPDISLIAEHGAWIKESGEDWHLIRPIESDWKDSINQIFEQFVDRTPGAFIEEKDFSLALHYRKATPELAKVRIGDLRDTLIHITQNQDLDILEGDKVIEVRNSGVNKGVAALEFVMETEPDFILAIGDDKTDEDTFIRLPEEAYTIKVGPGSTEARFNLKSVKEVRSFLKQLARQ